MHYGKFSKGSCCCKSESKAHTDAKFIELLTVLEQLSTLLEIVESGSTYVVQ